jgi:glycosyltransferase involved in cell wall biosynthesis
MATERRRLPKAALSTSEKTAIPLAIAARLRRENVPHVVIAHKLSSGLKKPFLRLWPLHRRFSHVICVSQAQADYAVGAMGLPPEKVTFLHDKVDHLYFEPSRNVDGDYILAVGNEQRDYDTLLAAVEGTGRKLVIVSSSPWSYSKPVVRQNPNVMALRGIPYDHLRTLYAGARLVVVPLKPVDYAAGANSLLEAMAMAKPVIVSRTCGLTGYVRDGETAVQVSPGRPRELRQAISSLWDRPERRQALGDLARQEVVDGMNIDCYASRIAAIMTSAILGRETR